MRLASLCAFLLLAAIGCNTHSDDEVVGKWVGKMKLSKDDIERAPQLGALAEAEYIKNAESTEYIFVVKDDGTYTLEGLGEFVVTDTWVIKGDEIVLASSGTNLSMSGGTRRGIPNQIPMRLKISKDAKSLTWSDSRGEMTSIVTFVRG